MGRPSALQAALEPPSSFAAGTLVFIAPSGILFQPNTTYALVMESPGGDSLSLASTTSNGEDSSSAAGWSIANRYAFEIAAGTWQSAFADSAFRITVKGYPTPDDLSVNANVPVFALTSYSRSLAENTAAGQNVGPPVTATDPNGDTLVYSLEGADAASFDIVSTSGQIQTKSGVTYDYEAKSTYAVQVRASDSANSNIASVSITITDMTEPPAAPEAPTVSAFVSSTPGVSVSWTAPANAGKPAIDSYDLRYRQGTSGSWTDGPQNVTTTTATISSLTLNTLYQVQVRATNADGDSPWSASGSASTGAAIWDATLTVASLGTTSGETFAGCNNSTTGGECSNSSVLTDDDFTHSSTVHSVTAAIRRFRWRSQSDHQPGLRPDPQPDPVGGRDGIRLLRRHRDEQHRDGNDLGELDRLRPELVRLRHRQCSS